MPRSRREGSDYDARVKSLGYFLLACAAIALIGWIVSKITGSKAHYIEDWQFSDGENVLWRDEQTDTHLIPKHGQALVMSFARMRRGSVVVTNRRILIGSLPVFGEKHMVQYVLYPSKAPGSEKLDGGLLTVGYQTIVFDPSSLEAHPKEAKPYVDLRPVEGERSSTNLERIRIFTDDAGNFRLPETP